MKQKIFVLYTGGTIGMKQSAHGLAPDTELASQALTPFAERFDFDWHICTPLIDSSAVTPQHWHEWLTLLAEKIPVYHGILVLHGTDTMAYTANVLALALQGLNKPVVLTGSQWPYNAPESDAPANLATAVAALELGLPEVCIAFNGALFPAVGSSKVSTETAAGFDNLHFGARAQWRNGAWETTNPAPKRPVLSDGLNVLPLNPAAQVACHTLIPGFAATQIAESLHNSRAQAAVLQSYGHGNTPDSPELNQAVTAFAARGSLLLNISQVPQGCAAAVYAQGSALRRAGAVSGGKCNLETATALLTLAASNSWTADTLRQKLAELGLCEAA